MGYREGFQSTVVRGVLSRKKLERNQCNPKSTGSWGARTNTHGMLGPALLVLLCSFRGLAGTPEGRKEGYLSVPALFRKNRLRTPSPGCEREFWRLELLIGGRRALDWTSRALHKGILDLISALLSLFS